MSTSKFEVEKFNRENDFTLRRIKMKALMVHQGTSAALDLKAQAAIEEKVLADVISKAHSCMIISLGVEVLRKVFEESTTLAISEKLNCSSLFT